MSEDRLGLLIVAIVAVVAVVSLFLLNSDGTMFVSDDESSALTGQAGTVRGGLTNIPADRTRERTTRDYSAGIGGSESSSRSCIDSDGGFDFKNRGVTQSYDGNSYLTKKDFCVNDYTVKEYYCRRDRISNVKTECSNIAECKDGACTVIAEYSTFDDDDGGWTVQGDAETSLPTYFQNNGNPDGYSSSTDGAVGGTWYWSAPSKYLGDKSIYYGKYLTFDLTQSSTTYQYPFTDIELVGTNGKTLVYFDFDNYNNFQPATSWTPYSIKLSAGSGWKVKPGSGFEYSTFLDDFSRLGDASEVQITSVLSSLSELRIRGEFRDGDDTGAIDNVYFGVRS